MGPIFQVRGDPVQAIALTREGMQISDRLLDQAPSAGRPAQCLSRAAVSWRRAPRHRRLRWRASDVREGARVSPTWPDAIRPEADYEHRLAVAQERLGDHLDASANQRARWTSFREALAEENAMLASAPDNTDYVRMVATAITTSATRWPVCGDRKRRSPRRAGHSPSTKSWRERIRATPARRRTSAAAHRRSRRFSSSGGQHRAAHPFIEQAESIRRELMNLDRGNVEYIDDLANTLTLWAESLIARHDPEAVAKADEGRMIREPIAAARPQQAVYARGLARSYTVLGDAYAGRAAAGRDCGAALDDWRHAQQSYRRALDMWTDLRGRRALWANEVSYPERVRTRLIACDRAVAGS